MADIIDFTKKTPDQPEVEPMFDYTFRRKGDAEPTTVAGIFTFNPIFAGVVDNDQRLVYCVPMTELSDVKRGEQVKAS